LHIRKPILAAGAYAQANSDFKKQRTEAPAAHPGAHYFVWFQ